MSLRIWHLFWRELRLGLLRHLRLVLRDLHLLLHWGDLLGHWHLLRHLLLGHLLRHSHGSHVSHSHRGDAHLRHWHSHSHWGDAHWGDAHWGSLLLLRHHSLFLHWVVHHWVRHHMLLVLLFPLLEVLLVPELAVRFLSPVLELTVVSLLGLLMALSAHHWHSLSGLEKRTHHIHKLHKLLRKLRELGIVRIQRIGRIVLVPRILLLLLVLLKGLLLQQEIDVNLILIQPQRFLVLHDPKLRLLRVLLILVVNVPVLRRFELLAFDLRRLLYHAPHHLPVLLKRILQLLAESAHLQVLRIQNRVVSQFQMQIPQLLETVFLGLRPTDIDFLPVVKDILIVPRFHHALRALVTLEANKGKQLLLLLDFSLLHQDARYRPVRTQHTLHLPPHLLLRTVLYVLHVKVTTDIDSIRLRHVLLQHKVRVQVLKPLQTQLSRLLFLELHVTVPVLTHLQ